MSFMRFLTRNDSKIRKSHFYPRTQQRYRTFVLSCLSCLSCFREFVFSCETVCSIIVVLALLAPVAPVHAQSDSARIVRLEHDWLDARDTIALNRILDSSFVHVTPQGAFLDKREHVAWMADHSPPANRVAHFEGLSVRIYGSTAIATGIVSARVGSAAPRRTAFTDVFIERRDGWKAVSAEETVIK